MVDHREIGRVARRRYWREADARVVVEAWRASGCSLREFCERHGLIRQRVTRWATRLGRTPEAMRFHPINVIDGGGGGGKATELGVIEIELRGGDIVRLPPSFALEDLRHVLQVLGESERC